MSFIPEVKMDFIPSDDDDENDDNITTEMQDFDEEKDITQDEIEEKKEEIVEEDIVPKAKSKREGMDVNEIFNMPNDTYVKDVKLTKKGKPRKQRPPMSEAHKEKLKAAREKAMAVRKAKAQEKKDAKALEKEEKELLKKQKVKRVKQLKEEVEEDETPKPIKETIREQMFSRKDLEEAQLNAIMNYEKIRKSRKEQKKIEQEKNKEQEALRNQIRRAVAPPQQEYNMFANCY